MGEDEFSQYYRVRWQTLRAPWGETEGSEKDERENETYHLAAFINNQVVGVARIQHYQMRKLIQILVSC
jgi:hypothetical protein